MATPGKQAGAMLNRLHLPRRPVSDFVENMGLVRGHVPVPQRHMLLPDGGLVLIFNLGQPQRLCERADVRRHAVFRASWVSGQQPQPIVIEQKAGLHYHRQGWQSQQRALAPHPARTECVYQRNSSG